MRYFAYFIFFINYSLFGQRTISSTQLSSKQLQKLEKIKSASKKLKKYRRYYSKDSLQAAKKYEKFLNKKWKNIGKDVETVASKKVRGVEKKALGKISGIKPTDSLNRLLGKVNLKPGNFLGASKIDTSLHFRTKQNKLLQGMQGDSLSLKSLSKLSLKVPSFNSYLKSAQIPELKELNKVKGEFGKYRGQLVQYQKQYGGYLSDSTRKEAIKKEVTVLEKEAQQRVMNNAYTGEFLKYQKQVDAYKADQLKYKKQIDQWQDSAYRKKAAKENAEKLAMKYINDNKQLVKGVQNKIQLLMKKYSVVPNSNDLSTAIKRTSLKGKAFRERLVIATNFQVLNYNPVTIDFSPMLGYKFNTRFAVGVGGTYRQTFGSTPSSLKFAPQVLGYKFFTSYDVVKNFFVYGEFARNSIPTKSDNGTVPVWKNAAIAAIGRKTSISRKIDMTMLVGYDFFHQPNDPVYPQAWIFRVGFQLSDLALMKRKPDLKLF
jgi:hypothetical protein